MAKIYYKYILKGTITLDDVPEKWREKVKEMLG